MSGFFARELQSLSPYVPGEQPQDKRYVKLNTNESPYFPTRYSIERIDKSALENLRLYSDPESGELCGVIAAYYGVNCENVIATNGSDEALAFAFAAFAERGAAFADITYGFYRVFAQFFKRESEIIPLKEDFTVDAGAFERTGKCVVIANPNAQTGIFLPVSEMEKIIKANENRVVVVDEAYVDFGGESCIPLIKKYKNLLVVQTFSKSRSLAGARVGFAIGDKELIDDLKRVKFSFNPYNVNRLSGAIAAEAMRDEEYFRECTKKIIQTREKYTNILKKMGFFVLPSTANFILAEYAGASGKQIYLKLKEKGILVRRFDERRIENFLRITIGSEGDMQALVGALEEIL